MRGDRLREPEARRATSGGGRPSGCRRRRGARGAMSGDQLREAERRMVRIVAAVVGARPWRTTSGTPEATGTARSPCRRAAWCRRRLFLRRSAAAGAAAAASSAARAGRPRHGPRGRAGYRRPRSGGWRRLWEAEAAAVGGQGGGGRLWELQRMEPEVGDGPIELAEWIREGWEREEKK
ncbi:hypothetical protein C2845_PM05G35880 [Panicum miliaceum]|uniref:Uncharacterized protein n=1 Tax=Panicum miliaceum TaxID=4540 RepID=A0A3L6T4X1_PANMI|nr:hypothetical protein C2845_PM05G35880 [Panicum miliaceum]